MLCTLTCGVNAASGLGLQTCTDLGPGCGGFVRNTDKYASDKETHCFLYPVANVEGPGQTVVKCAAGSMYLRAGLPIPPGGCAAPPVPPVDGE